MKEKRSVHMTAEILNRIKVLRYGVDKGGFQRQLREEKVLGVIEAAKKGINIPSVNVVELSNGDLICSDGQHRIEAWSRFNFPMFVLISQGNLKTACDDFVSLNGNVSRASKGLRLKVDRSEYCEKLRQIAGEYSVAESQADRILFGITGGRNQKADASEIELNEWMLAKTVLSMWTADKRWTGTKRNREDANYIYASSPWLTVLGKIAKQNPTQVRRNLQILKTWKYAKKSTLGSVYGTTTSDFARMRDVANNFLTKHT